MKITGHGNSYGSEQGPAGIPIATNTRPQICWDQNKIRLDGSPLVIKVDKNRPIVRVGCTEITFFAFKEIYNKCIPHMGKEDSVIDIQE